MFQKTRTKFQMDNNGKNLVVHWTADEDGHGYKGECTIFAPNKNDKIYEGSVISVRQGQPLGSISFQLDVNKGGASAFAGFEGTGITERDLQWATAWAYMAIRMKLIRNTGKDIL